MREKLLNLIKSEGMTSSRLAEILEIQPSGVSHILSGRNKPGFDLLQKILRRFPRINPDWLLLDSDKMYRDDNGTPTNSFSPNTKSDDNLFTAAISNPNSTTSPIEAQAQSSPTTAAHLHTQQISRTDVVRVVVFYSDQTCESFAPKK